VVRESDDESGKRGAVVRKGLGGDNGAATRKGFGEALNLNNASAAALLGL
jgi:hypothetical protein